MNNLSGRHNELLLSCEQGNDCPEQLVHEGILSLLVRETFQTLFGIIGFEEGVPDDHSLSQKVDVLAQDEVFLLGDAFRPEYGETSGTRC